jgi:hypothetical protein
MFFSAIGLNHQLRKNVFCEFIFPSVWCACRLLLLMIAA